VSTVTERLTMIDLFAGCGGMRAGFVQHGFQPVLAVEFDLYAPRRTRRTSTRGTRSTATSRRCPRQTSRRSTSSLAARTARASRTWVRRTSTTHATSFGASTYGWSPLRAEGVRNRERGSIHEVGRVSTARGGGEWISPTMSSRSGI
jgi:C-5 cytosine-specific DNA methylase